MIRRLIPASPSIAVLINPKNPNAEDSATELRDAARTLGQSIRFVNASNDTEIDAAFAALRERQVSALLVNTDPFFLAQRAQFAALAARDRLPAIYAQREYVAAGGLISCGVSLADGYRQVGIYAGRILRGEKPADLPVVQPTKFELALNLKAAKALGLEVPDGLLALADEVIE